MPHGIMGNVAKHHGSKKKKALWDMGTPLWTDRLMDGQTRVKTLPSLVLRTRAVKKNYGMGTPPVDRQIDGWTDTCQNITFPSYYVRGR